MGDLELQIFADRLKELRTSLNLTQAQFVEDLGFTPSALSAYEKNLKNPSISVAKQIAEKYNVSIDWLCGLSEQRNIENECSTYSDIINIFVALERYLEFELKDITPSDGFDGFEYIPRYQMTIFDEKLGDFFKEWEKMRKLYIEKTIDYDLYRLWLDREIKKYNDFKVYDQSPFV